MMMWGRIVLFFVLACALAGILSAWGQQVQGSFTGIVTDSSGATIPGAKVSAANPDTGFSKIAKTQSDGSYEIPLLPPGRYTLTAESSNFQRATQSVG